jgi:hypothetical protein
VYQGNKTPPFLQIEYTNWTFKDKKVSNDPDCDALTKAKERLLDKINKAWVAQSLFFDALSLDFKNLAIN